jgi:hypothetical protein
MTLEEQIIEVLAKKKARSLIQVVAELNRNANGHHYHIREIEEVLRRMPGVFQNDHRKYGLRNRRVFEDPGEAIAG